MADLGKLFSLQLQLHRYDNGATEVELQRYVLTVDAILELLASTAKYCQLPQDWQIHFAPHHFSSKFQVRLSFLISMRLLSSECNCMLCNVA